MARAASAPEDDRATLVPVTDRRAAKAAAPTRTERLDHVLDERMGVSRLVVIPAVDEQKSPSTTLVNDRSTMAACESPTMSELTIGSCVTSSTRLHRSVRAAVSRTPLISPHCATARDEDDRGN